MDIVRWMKKNKVTAKKIAGELQMSETAVRGYISGAWNSSKIEKWLLSHGCPQEVIDKLKAKREEKKKFLHYYTKRRTVDVFCPFETDEIKTNIPGVYANSTSFCPLR
jgi:predicted transcriptional regulator